MIQAFKLNILSSFPLLSRKVAWLLFLLHHKECHVSGSDKKLGHRITICLLSASRKRPLKEIIASNGLLIFTKNICVCASCPYIIITSLDVNTRPSRRHVVHSAVLKFRPRAPPRCCTEITGYNRTSVQPKHAECASGINLYFCATLSQGYANFCTLLYCLVHDSAVEFSALIGQVVLIHSCSTAAPRLKTPIIFL